MVQDHMVLDHMVQDHMVLSHTSRPKSPKKLVECGKELNVCMLTSTLVHCVLKPSWNLF